SVGLRRCDVYRGRNRDRVSVGGGDSCRCCGRRVDQPIDSSRDVDSAEDGALVADGLPAPGQAEPGWHDDENGPLEREREKATEETRVRLRLPPEPIDLTEVDRRSDDRDLERIAR